MKILFLFLIIFLIAIQPLTSLTFKYSFLFQTADTSIPQAIDHKSIVTKLSSGDQLKIYLKPIKNAYIFLFFQDTSDALYLLFPTMISDFNGFYKFNKNYLTLKGVEVDGFYAKTIRIEH